VVDDLSLPALELDPDDAHHLASALRLRPGEAVGATDGQGGYRLCEYAGPGRLVPVSPLTSALPRLPPITVGLVPVKGDRPEWAVQKLTELGVDRIVILRSARSIVRWDDGRAGTHLQRLRRVARSAAMQSRQVWLPSIEGVRPVGDLLGLPGTAMADMDGAPPGPEIHTILVGPEGGWTDEERALAVGPGGPGTVPVAGAVAGPGEPGEVPVAGAGRVGLGPGVLRAETAAVAAGVLLAALRAGLVGPVAGVPGVVS
jgi:16S rRNA (uracil1498-N3)-methyltransferase